MSLAHVLVHVDPSAGALARLRFARAVAAAQGASVTAVYAVMPMSMAVPAAAFDGGAAVSMLMDLQAEQLRRVRSLVDEEARGPGPAQGWLDDTAGSPYRLLARAAWTGDLLVMAPRDDRDPGASAVPADLLAQTLIDSGRPTLVLPPGAAGTAVPDPRHLVLAWKPTREAARAMAATLPWLRSVQRIDLVAGPGPAVGDADWPDAEPLERWLRGHGFAGVVQRHSIAPHPAAEAGQRLQELAARVGAHWLVMGCYGHSRARELLLGGASRSVLREPALPVLMVH